LSKSVGDTFSPTLNFKKKGGSKMPRNQRIKTKYAGVYFIEGQRTGYKDQTEKIYYVVYRRQGKKYEEKAGRQFRDDMTAARAAALRGAKIEGLRPSNTARRKKEKEEKADLWTFNQLWEEYKKRHAANKALTIDDYRYERHIKGPLGNRRPQDLNLETVEKIRDNLLKAMRPGTARNVLQQITRIAKFGSKRGLCLGLQFDISIVKTGYNPAECKTEDLSPEEIKNLLKAIKEDKHPHAGAMLKLVLLTGMRRGELFRLQRKDINFRRGFITLRNPKGGRDQRIPLNDGAAKLLEKHLKTHGSDYVFPGPGGGQRKDIDLRSIRERAGLPKDFRMLHGLRHTFASMLASSGKVDLYQLQRLLTHKSPQMTQRYAHLRDEALKQASDIASLANYQG
jgi:integrase